MPAASNRLPDGELPDGVRPRIRGIDDDSLRVLGAIDRRQDELDGDPVPVDGLGDIGTIATLHFNGLVRLDGRPEDGGLVVGVTQGGDRALQRYDRRRRRR